MANRQTSFSYPFKAAYVKEYDPSKRPPGDGSKDDTEVEAKTSGGSPPPAGAKRDGKAKTPAKGRENIDKAAEAKDKDDEDRSLGEGALAGEDAWPREIRPRLAKSKRTTSERPNANTEDEDDDGSESGAKRKRHKASSADFPEHIIGRGNENLPLSELASFSSVLRSYGREEKTSRHCEVHRVQGLKYSTAKLPICEFTYCNKPREKHELVVCGCYVDTQGILEKTRGVMVLCAPVTSDFERPDTIEWVRVTSIKPLMPTGEEVHEDDVERIRLAADAEMSRLLADDAETTKGDGELEDQLHLMDDLLPPDPDYASGAHGTMGGGRTEETPTRGRAAGRRDKPGAGWLGRVPGGSGGETTATRGSGQPAEKKTGGEGSNEGDRSADTNAVTDRVVQQNSLAIQEILAMLKKTQPTNGPPVQPTSSSSGLPLPIPSTHPELPAMGVGAQHAAGHVHFSSSQSPLPIPSSHTSRCPRTQVGTLLPQGAHIPAPIITHRCCQAHRKRCATCHDTDHVHVCQVHHSLHGRDQLHPFMSAMDRLRDAHSKAVLIIKQYEAKEMARVNEVWGYNSHLNFRPHR